MKNIRKWTLALALLFSGSSYSNTLLSDMSDLWWNANESGWGVSIAHQGEVVFLTYYVFGADGRANWYVGQATYGGKNGQGAYVFTGPMYVVNGPWFGTTFNPNNLGARAVGNMTLSAFLDFATLSYSIDGVNVTKNITRQTFRANNLTGEFMGAMKSTQAGCRPPFVNADVNDPVEFSVTHAGSNFSMRVVHSDRSSCTYTGDYVQAGRFGSSLGTYVCTGGVSGNYDAVEIEANTMGFMGRYSASDNVCSSISGRFAAMKK
ncbi:MAG: hypothetical protein JNN20_14705 [Betaproteobacteria bacterium]|nr:hypothetical protein [Betaproteobacteria bacterium]